MKKFHVMKTPLGWPVNSGLHQISRISFSFKRTLTIVLFFVGFLSISFPSSAVNYYSRTSGGNWTATTTWSTVGYGNTTNTGTYPQAGDNVFIGDGYTIYVNASVSCASITIGQGLSGVLEYRSTANYTMNVTGNVTLNTGSTFWYNTATSRSHRLNLGGNFSNYGTVDFYVSIGQVVDLVFNTAGNSTVAGTGTWDLNNVTLNKTTSTAASLTVNTNSFETAIKSFSGTYGTYVHNNVGTYSINPTTATLTIGPNMIYQVPMGTMWFASAADNVFLQGTLTVNGGTARIGTTAGIQGLRTDQNGAFVPTLNVTSGSLIVYGGITYGGSSTAEPFNFNMSGGNILLNSGSTGTNRQVFCVNDVAGSNFTMSGGTITLQKPNITGVTTVDFMVCGTNGSVASTNGVVVFGNASTVTGTRFNFRPFAGVTQPHFRVTGPAANSVTLAPSTSSTANFRLLSLQIESGKTFDIRSISGSAGDAKTMTLLSTANGSDALLNNGTYTARQSTVTFATTGAQCIGGTSTTTFYNLSINNSSGITLNRAANVSNYLSMVNGKLFTTNTNVLTCLAGASASMGSNTSFVDGPMVHTIATATPATRTYPIGKAASYRPVVLNIRHTSSTAVTYRGEIFNSSASGLPFSLPPTIQNVSAVRYARFTRTGTGNFSTGTIQMFYDTDDVVADKNTLLVAQDNGGTTWVNRGGTASADWTGNIISSSFTSFPAVNYFALGNPPGGGNPLPIELATFSAELVKKKVEMKWTTQAEINNDYFTVERSPDNINFEQIGTLPGSGTTSQTHDYNFTDESPLRGISYYRLRQTDFDGKTEYFPAVVIRNMRSTFTVYPNPATSPAVHIAFDSDLLQYYTVNVQDITGREIPFRLENRQNGDTQLVFDEAWYKPGSMYIISASDGMEVMKEKLILQ